VQCIKCTCWSHSACSDGSDINVYDICQDVNTGCDLQCHSTLDQPLHEFFCVLVVPEMVYCIDCVLKTFTFVFVHILSMRCF